LPDLTLAAEAHSDEDDKIDDEGAEENFARDVPVWIHYFLE
jgi:hypothetical protein